MPSAEGRRIEISFDLGALQTTAFAQSDDSALLMIPE
jgi:hypothetical protein